MQTPQDIINIGVLSTDGTFEQSERKRYFPSGKMAIFEHLKPINGLRFGTYFLKCSTPLNSIIKKTTHDPSRIQRVVKDRIGCIMPKDMHIGKRTNTRYATETDVYYKLHRDHVALACKPLKREIISAFCDLKEDFIIKFNSLKNIVKGFISHTILISDVYNMSYSCPTRSLRYPTNMGYVDINHRNISKEDLVITITDRGNRFASYNETVDKHVKGHYRSGGVTIKIGFREQDHQYDDSREAIRLCSIDINGDGYVIFNVYNTKFNGIDITGIINAVVAEYDTFADDFNLRLEQIKEEYITEYLLNEICDPTISAI